MRDPIGRLTRRQQRLVAESLNFVRYLLGEHMRRYPFTARCGDDMYQEGVLEMMKTAYTFEEKHQGTQFVSYAAPGIKHAFWEAYRRSTSVFGKDIRRPGIEPEVVPEFEAAEVPADNGNPDELTDMKHLSESVERELIARRLEKGSFYQTAEAVEYHARRDAQLFVMTKLGGMEHKEAGARFGIKGNRVGKLLSRAEMLFEEWAEDLRREAA